MNGFANVQPLDKRRTRVRSWRKSCNPDLNSPSSEASSKGRDIIGLDGRVWNLPLENSGSWWGGRDESYDPPRDREFALRMAREMKERQQQQLMMSQQRTSPSVQHFSNPSHSLIQGQGPIPSQPQLKGQR